MYKSLIKKTCKKILLLDNLIEQNKTRYKENIQQIIRVDKKGSKSLEYRGKECPYVSCDISHFILIPYSDVEKVICSCYSNNSNENVQKFCEISREVEEFFGASTQYDAAIASCCLDPQNYNCKATLKRSILIDEYYWNPLVMEVKEFLRKNHTQLWTNVILGILSFISAIGTIFTILAYFKPAVVIVVP